MGNIAVIGAGSFGTCLAFLLGENGFQVNLWARREELSRKINNKRENEQYLPGITLPDGVIAYNSLKNVLNGSELIVMAIPSDFLMEVTSQIKHHYSGQIIVSTTKGLSYDESNQTCKRMSQLIQDILGKVRIVTLSGPNHSKELSRKMPTAGIVASMDKKSREKVASYFSTDYFKLYPLNDVIGVEICGALKNISAIASGVCDGLGIGNNSKGAILTLGLTEMNNFGKHFGAKRGTVYGLAGVGDLIATCISENSRNRLFGEYLAKGRTIQEIKRSMHGMMAEGIPTTKAVYEYSSKHNIAMPLTQQAYNVLFENKDIKKAMSDLLKVV